MAPATQVVVIEAARVKASAPVVLSQATTRPGEVAGVAHVVVLDHRDPDAGALIAAPARPVRRPAGRRSPS